MACAVAVVVALATGMDIALGVEAGDGIVVGVGLGSGVGIEVGVGDGVVVMVGVGDGVEVGVGDGMEVGLDDGVAIASVGVDMSLGAADFAPAVKVVEMASVLVTATMDPISENSNNVIESIAAMVFVGVSPVQTVSCKRRGLRESGSGLFFIFHSLKDSVAQIEMYQSEKGKFAALAEEQGVCSGKRRRVSSP